MNKKELIRKYEELWKEHSPFHEPVPYTSMVELFLKELKLLDEPEKVKVPQFVAEYIEFKKTYDFHVYGAMREIEDHHDKRVPEWFYEKNIETFARAWLDGYEVEKEKRYRVKLKSNSEEIDYLVNTERNGLRFYSVIYTQRREHTRKELEDAGFGWVFDCTGIEIEEVQDE